jgi:hypothetical protein
LAFTGIFFDFHVVVLDLVFFRQEVALRGATLCGCQSVCLAANL